MANVRDVPCNAQAAELEVERMRAEMDSLVKDSARREAGRRLVEQELRDRNAEAQLDNTHLVRGMGDAGP